MKNFMVFSGSEESGFCFFKNGRKDSNDVDNLSDEIKSLILVVQEIEGTGLDLFSVSMLASRAPCLS